MVRFLYENGMAWFEFKIPNQFSFGLSIEQTQKMISFNMFISITSVS